MIVQAQASDYKALTQLTQQSKAHWGYSAEQLQKWEEDLTITISYLSSNLVYKYLETDQLIGYYSLIFQDKQTVILDNLFIHPTFIGKGYGSLLLADAIKKAKAAGHLRMTLDADPHAEQFYLSKGFTVVGQLPTSIPNRYLPVMTLPLF